MESLSSFQYCQPLNTHHIDSQTLWKASPDGMGRAGVQPPLIRAASIDLSVDVDNIFITTHDGQVAERNYQYTFCEQLQLSPISIILRNQFLTYVYKCIILLTIIQYICVVLAMHGRPQTKKLVFSCIVLVTCLCGGLYNTPVSK